MCMVVGLSQARCLIQHQHEPGRAVEGFTFHNERTLNWVTDSTVLAGRAPNGCQDELHWGLVTGKGTKGFRVDLFFLKRQGVV